MRPEDRFDFSALPQRPRRELPDGKRMAVYCVVNVEEWDIEKPVAREYVSSPAGVVTVPNLPNWAWHEYGMRVGFWRILEFLDKKDLRATGAVNARVCLGNGEPVARAMLEAGWEFMGHGYYQAAMHTVADQQKNICDTFSVLSDYSGRAPKGWLGPGLHQTLDTLDYLAEAGFRYVVDLPMDEQPVTLKTTSESMVAMPYTLELSDLPMMVVHQHESRVWYERVVDQFDRLYQDSLDQPRIMSLSIHPYIMGVPHRIKHFEAAYEHMLQRDDVWFATGEELYDWYISGN